MRKIIVSEYVSLDGVMEDPGGSEGTPNGGWSFKYWSDEIGKYKYDELFASDALLLGRTTYEGFAKAWPSVKDEAGFGDRMNGLPKYVVSTTLEKADWNNTTVIRENDVDAITQLKQQPGQAILVAGSARLVTGLLRYNLVDELRLLVHPVILGSGKRLFEAGVGPVHLQLADLKPFNTGIVALTYCPPSP